MIVTISDLGNSEYLGVVKGVICSIAPKAQIIDLYNSVNPFSIREAAWILLKNYYYFPKKTIFLCVVDPTVGSNRQAVAIETKNYFFIGPDNGLFYETLQKEKPVKIIKLISANASNTFHARDIFAKAAGLLEKGKKITALGKKTTLSFKLEFYSNGRNGEIIRIDHFGNIITNIPHISKKEYTVNCNNRQLKLPFFRIYAESPTDNSLFLIESSCNTLEIAVKNGSAYDKLSCKVGDRITIE
jgi:S-adenosylmethionine hydrolase